MTLLKNDLHKFGILADEKALYTITENEEMEKMFLSVAKDVISFKNVI